MKRLKNTLEGVSTEMGGFGIGNLEFEREKLIIC